MKQLMLQMILISKKSCHTYFSFLNISIIYLCLDDFKLFLIYFISFISI